VLILLAQDFYRPVPLLTLFSKLFPDEQYNPDSSPNRTQQAIKRLRQWLKECDLPAAVEECDGSYRWSFTGPFAVAIPREPIPLTPREAELRKLRASVVGETFSAAEAAAAMGFSRSSVQRLLQWAIAECRLEVHGKTVGARYRWPISDKARGP
jgi:predicted DNA-binding protein (UPF0251 family)